ncbi:oxygen-insensitive NAD(P)H nitroreductase [Mollicutes bacterium LVI A0078]|nr:oxygen-insensitive NAD(P)H nitroreductase [Mollicutes bacterium LVI A0075]WOO91039.1 oxygen-insensitive NAD(P)H nitroreductase [Mollicutes bacterium LVI A0078]
MKLEQTIDKRYTVKKFDNSAVISEEDLKLIKKLLQEAPSSVNVQPWHFTIATTKEGKEAVAKSTANFGFNDEKIRDAAALVVFSVADVNDQHLTAVVEKEDRDGRYANEEFKTATDNGRRYFHSMNKESGREFEWLKSQVYLNAGHFVLGTSIMGLDSVIMEGFDPKVLNEELQLGANTPVLIIGLGKKADDDYNAALPKSRLDQDLIIDLI